MTYAVKKLSGYGTQALSNAELFSVAFGVNEEIARAALEYTEGEPWALDVKELSEVYGIGERKAAAVISAGALYKRLSAGRALDIGDKMKDSRQVAQMLYSEYLGDKKERFMAIGLNSKLQVEYIETVSIGNLDSAPVHPREVFKTAVKKSCAAVIVAHNHPSGDPAPSPQDIDVTRRLKEAGDLLGIKMIDHVIVGGNDFTSMKSEGYMD